MSTKDRFPKPEAPKQIPDRGRFEKGEQSSNKQINERRLPTSDLNPPLPKPKGDNGKKG